MKTLIFYFHLMKNVAETLRVLVELGYVLSEATCRSWFQQFGDIDFNMRNEKQPKAL